MTAARPAALALALAAGALPACADPSAPAVTAAPRELVFAPGREALELRLVNHTASPVPLSRIRFDPRVGDWGAFTIEDRHNPQEIAAAGAVSLHLRAHRDRFAGKQGERAGRSRLLLVADGAPLVVDVRYDPGDPTNLWSRALTRLAALAALAALAWVALRRGPRLAWTAWLPALAVLAVLPLGAGLCPGHLGDRLTPVDLAQCADHRGGSPFALVAAAEGWLVALVALVVAAIGRLAGEDGASTGARRLASRDLALAAAFAGPLLSFGTLDPTALTLAQQEPWFAAIPWLPRWGLLAQPLAAVVALAAAAVPPSGRLERLTLAAAFAACFLGGAGPFTPTAGLPHGAALAIGALILMAKITAVFLFVTRLHATSAGSHARLWLGSLERTALPLALASLLATAILMALR